MFVGQPSQRSGDGLRGASLRCQRADDALLDLLMARSEGLRTFDLNLPHEPEHPPRERATLGRSSTPSGSTIFSVSEHLSHGLDTSPPPSPPRSPVAPLGAPSPGSIRARPSPAPSLRPSTIRWRSSAVPLFYTSRFVRPQNPSLRARDFPANESHMQRSMLARKICAAST